MALTIAGEFAKAALDGGCALLNNGQFRLTDGGVELALLTFSATAFAGASTANPSVAVSNSITADASVSAGFVDGFALRTSGGSARISGTVGVGSGDLQVTDDEIPATATSVTCTGGLTLSLTLS